MARVTTSFALALLLTCLASPLHADLIHKWVDADGVTHYSDEPPADAATTATGIELPAAARRVAQPQNDYYSIDRQWQRMRQERLERDRIALEKARIRAARQARETVPAARAPEYAVSRPVYPVYFKHRHRFFRPRAQPVSKRSAPPGLHPGRNQLRGGFNPLP